MELQVDDNVVGIEQNGVEFSFKFKIIPARTSMEILFGATSPGVFVGLQALPAITGMRIRYECVDCGFRCNFVVEMQEHQEYPNWKHRWKRFLAVLRWDHV